LESTKSSKRLVSMGVIILLLFLTVFSYYSPNVDASRQTIIINPGHQVGTDSGAVNSTTGITEVELNNALAIKIVTTLRNNGYNAMLSHQIPENTTGLPTLLATTTNDSTQIANAANKLGADLVISVHHNSGGTTASGYEFYWSSYHPSVDTNGLYEVTGLWSDGSSATLDSTPCAIALKSKELANLFNTNFKSLDYVPSRNKIVERDDAFTRKTSMPSVLIEAGFVSNDAESLAMADGGNQQKMADQVLVSVNQLFGNDTSTTVIKADSVKATVSGNQITATVSGINAPDSVKTIYFPVWSEVGGQDDIKWYTATKQSDGSYSLIIDIKDHNYNNGVYNIHCYAVDNSGNLVFLGNTTANVSTSAQKMTADSISNSVSGNQITTTVKGITAPNGIQTIYLPTWSETGGQDDIKWYAATKQSDGSYSLTIDIKDHNYDNGVYNIHCYGVDNSGNTVFLGNTTANVTAQKMTASNISSSVSGTQITATIKGITAPNGIQTIYLPTWSETGGQDDIKWYTATKQSDGSYSLTIDIKNHNYDSGIYNIHCYGADSSGNLVFLGQTTVNVTVSAMTASDIEASVTENKITVSVGGITAPNGIKNILVPTWSDNGGQDDIKWYTATKQSDGTYGITIDAKNHNGDSGDYSIHVYGVENDGRYVFLGNTSVNVRYVETPIMGETTVTAAELVAYYKSTGSVYPQVYNNLGVNLEKFVDLYIQECNAEGIRAEVAFAQAMLETGNLQFGGDVSVNQFNFAGLGATGGVPGFDFAATYGNNSFGLQMGIRGHVQHLKCYASDEPLNQTKVDPRWNDTLRLRAISVEELAGTWAADKTYATKVKAVMNKF